MRRKKELKVSHTQQEQMLKFFSEEIVELRKRLAEANMQLIEGGGYPILLDSQIRPMCKKDYQIVLAQMVEQYTPLITGGGRS